MALSMENPLQPSFEVQLARTVHDTQGCIEELRKEWEDNGLPLTDDSQMLQRFCAKLEYLLQAGMKSKSSLIGGKKDYWNYISECLSGNKGLNDGLRFVKSLSELKTSLGRGRALVRFCLVHQRLADTLQQCAYNHKITSDWYLPNAVWLTAGLVSTLINALYDLNDLQFDLSPSGYDLDTSWPTFARKTFNMGSTWSPPSRTISVSSLASTQDIAHSFSSEAEIEKYKTQLNDTENAKLHLQVKLDNVEDVRTNLQQKISELEIQLSNSQRTSNQFEVTCDKLETELKLREETWVEKEALWKTRLAEAEKATGETNKKETPSETKTPAANVKEQFEMTELRVKLATEQRTNSALRLDLRSTQMELNMKTKLDTQKTTLVDLLERKVQQVQTRNNELFAKLEDSTSKPMEAQEGRLNFLLEQLKACEKANEDMMGTNTELRKMLNELEDKSCKVAQIAKEKVLKYVDLNKTLQETVEELTEKMKTTGSGNDTGEVTRLMEELKEAKERIRELEGDRERGEDPSISATDLGDSPIHAMKSGYERLQERIENGDETDSLMKIKADKTDLEKKLAELEAEKVMLKTENEKLCDVVSNKNSELDDLQKDLAGVKGILTGLAKNMDGSEKDEDVEDSLMVRARTFMDEYSQISISLQVANSHITELTEKLREETGTSGGQQQEPLVREELSSELCASVEVSVPGLKSKVMSLQDDLAQKVTELEHTRSEVQEYQGQIKTLRESLFESSEKLLVLMQHQAAAEKTIAENKTLIQNLQQQNSELEKYPGGIPENLQNTETRSLDLEKQDTEHLVQLHEKLTALKEKTVTLEAEIQNNQTVINEKDKLVKALTKKLETSQEVLEECKKSIFDNENQLTSLREENEELKISQEVSISELKTKVVSLQDELSLKLKELEAAQSEVQDNQAEIETLRQSLDECSQELLVEIKQQATAEETIAQNKTVIQNLQQENLELEESLKDLSENMRNTETRSLELEKHNMELDIQLREMNLLHENKQKEYSSLEKRYNEVVDIESSLLKELDDTKKTLEKLQQAKQYLVQKLVTSEGRVRALEGQVTLATEGTSAIDNQLAALHEELTALKGNTATLESEIQMKQLVIQEKEKLESELTERLETCQESLEEFKRSICDKENRLTIVCEENEKLKTSQAELSNQLKAAAAEMEQTKTSLEGNVESLEQQLGKAQAECLMKHQASEAEWAAESGRLKGEVIRLEMERNAANQAMEEGKRNALDLADEITALKEDLMEHGKKLELLQSEVKEKDELVPTLRSEIELLNSEKHTEEQHRIELESRISTLTEEVGRVSVDKNNLMSAADLMSMKTSQMENMMEAKEGEVSEMLSDLQAKKNQLSHLQQELDKLQAEKRVLQSSLDASLVELGQLEKSLEFAQKENSEVHEKLQQSSSRLETDCESAQKTIQELSEKLDSLSGEKCRLEQCIEEIKKEKADLAQNVTQKDHELSACVCELEKLKGEHTEVTRKMCSSEESWVLRQREWEKAREALDSELAALKFEISTSQLQRQNSHHEELQRHVSQHEVVVDQLETQLQELGEEYSKQEEKVSGLEERLKHKEAAYSVQSEQLQQLVEQHEELVTRHRHFQDDVEATAEEHDGQVRQFMDDMDLLKNDNERLREQLVKIVKDKASLWQQKDQLDVIRRMVVGAKWMDSSTVTHCLKCTQEFTFLVRKHHCRLCGRIFCFNCCDNWILTAYSSKKERTCDECVMAHSLAENVVNEGSESDEEEGDKRVSTPPGGSMMTHSRTSITSGLPENTETVTADDLASAGVASGEDLENPPASSSPGGPRSMTASAIGYAAEWLLGRKTSTSEEKELPSPPPETSAEESPRRAEASPGPMNKNSPSGNDPYDVITQEEIIESLHESILEHDPKMVSHGTIRADELEDGVVTSDPDLWVKPGMTLAIPVIIPDVGYKLHWTFKTQPKDIGFGMNYKECLLNYDEEGSLLIQTIKCNSHKRAIEGELVARQTGVYTLLFDNTHSRFTHKQLEYTLKVYPPGAAVSDDVEGPPDVQSNSNEHEPS